MTTLHVPSPIRATRLLLACAAAGLALTACGTGDGTPPAVVLDMTPLCDAAQTLCGGACANLKTDAKNCGACGTACKDTEFCDQGRCALFCTAGLSACGQSCIDLTNDVKNCGGCGMACPPGNVCSAGRCTLSCQQGLTDCSGNCVNLDTDNTNCGSCGMACGPGTACSAGKCEVTCQQGLTNCKGTCANLQTDNLNCGQCGQACAPGTACVAGACSVGCALPLAVCNGACVDPRFDPSNCNGCGTVCPMRANAAAACVNSACGITCNAGYADCDADGANGCEINVVNDKNNCNGCGNACPARANAASICVNRVCGITCNANYDDCDRVPTNGCEINLLTDANNCGQCGHVCAGGCLNGKCNPLPKASYAASVTFTDALASTSMTMAYDGTSYWTASGGSTGGNRLAKYTALGAVVKLYAPGYDWRSIFSKNGNGTTIYGRSFNSNQIVVMSGDGTFTNAVLLTGGTLDQQSAVVFDDTGAELIALAAGTVTRWDAKTGALLGTVTLSGFGSQNSENSLPQNRGILKRGGYYLTYAGGVLTAWDGAGNRVTSTTLTGAGTSFDSYYSFSYANGMVWIVDSPGGTWRGYNIGL